MSRNDRQLPHLTLHSDGFSWTPWIGQGRITVRWSEIVEIVAFKHDLWAYDMICLGLRMDGTDEILEVAEECPGYQQWLQVVEGRFQLVDDWWRRTAYPAFVMNLSTIWQRD